MVVASSPVAVVLCCWSACCAAPLSSRAAGLCLPVCCYVSSFVAPVCCSVSPLCSRSPVRCSAGGSCCLSLLLFAPAVSVAPPLSSVLSPPPPCRPPAAAHGRPLREPRRRAQARPVQRARDRTGDTRREGWVLNRALTERLSRLVDAGRVCVRYTPPGLHRTSCSVAWLHRSISRRDGTERNHDNPTPVPWSGCGDGTPRGPVPSSPSLLAFHLGCIVQPVLSSQIALQALDTHATQPVVWSGPPRDGYRSPLLLHA